MNKESLLLYGSTIFDDPKPIDCIRQSCMDLKKDTDQEIVSELLEKYYQELEENTNYNVACEIIYFIGKIISYFPSQVLPILHKHLGKVRTNSYTIISAASVLSFISNNKPELLNQDFNSFINDLLKEIQSQIQNFDKFIVFGHEIPFQFKADLIFDILLSVKPTKEIIASFSQVLISNDILSENKKFSLFIKKISAEGLITSIPDSLLVNSYVFNQLSINDIQSILPNLSDQIFIQIHLQIENAFKNSQNVDGKTIINYLNKCALLKLEPENIEYYLDYLSSSDFTPEICQFLKQFEFTLKKQLVEKFIDFPDIDFLIQILPEINVINEETLMKILALKIGDKNPDFSSPQSYIRLYSLFESIECPLKLTQIIVNVFKKFVIKSRINEVLDEIIFAVYPTTKNLAKFLSQLMKELGDEYSTLFSQDDHMKMLVGKIIDKKVIPHYIFVKLLDQEVVYQYLQKDGKFEDPFLLYLFNFSKMKSSDLEPIQLKELTIIPTENLSEEKLVDFLNNFSLSKMIEYDEQLLSLVTSAIIFGRNKEKMNVKGLTKENVIPFYSIASMLDLYFKTYQSLDYLSTPEMMSLFIEGIKSLGNSESLIITTSIDVFMLNLSIIEVLRKDVKLEILSILSGFLENGEYHADIKHLVEVLIKNGKENVHLHSPSLVNSLDKVIKNDDSDKVVYIGKFLVEHGLEKEVSEYFNKSENNNSSIKLEILPPKYLNVDDIISYILSKGAPQSKPQLYELLFKKMMSEKTNRIGYFQTIFENLKGPSTTPKELIDYFYDEYNEYKDDFINALDRVLSFHPTENVFIPKADHKPFDLPDSEFNTKIINRLYEIVLEDPKNFQAYTCLEYLSTSFPFIFASNPQKLFEAALPGLDYLSYIFVPRETDNEKNEMDIRKGKASIAALSFLLTASNSTKVFDAYFPWFFENYQKFSIYQIFGALIVFAAGSNITILGSISTKFIKYDFYKVLSQILLKEIPNNSLFISNFNHVLYDIISAQLSLWNYLAPSTVLSIEDNLDKEDLFYFQSGKCITHCVGFIKSLNSDFIRISLPDTQNMNASLLMFMTKIWKFKPKWLTEFRNKNENISQEHVDDFIENYKKVVTLGIPAKSIKIYTTDDTSIGNIRYFLQQEKWISQYSLIDKTFPLLEDHNKILSELLENMPKPNTDSDKLAFRNFNCKEYLISHCFSEEMIRSFIFRIKDLTLDPIELYIEALKKMSISPKFADIFFSELLEIFKYINQNYYYFSAHLKQLFKLIEKVVMNIKSKLAQKEIDKDLIYLNSQHFFETCGYDFIDFVLDPHFRTNHDILKIFYHCFSLFDNYPLSVLHIISIMFLTGNKSLCMFAAELCNGFTKDELEYCEILDDILLEEMDKKDPQITIISYLIKAKPELAASHKSELIALLSEQLKKYKNQLTENKANPKDDENAVIIDDETFIIQMIDILAPNRDNNSSFTLSDFNSTKEHKDDPNFLFCPIPDFIYQASPKFWAVFEMYRPIINDMILKKLKENKTFEPNSFLEFIIWKSISQFSSRFVNNYPECFTFDFRSTYFFQVMHDKIWYVDPLELEIDRQNILRDSYNLLHELEPSDWKKRFVIKYKLDEGIDAGGLTKDWLLKLSQEIFSPNCGLFEASANGNFSPSRSSKAQTKENLEIFKFIGMFIARALIQNEFIDAHFTHAFLKLILHHEKNIDVNDLEDSDESLFRSMKFYLDLDFDQNPNVDQRFEIDDENGEAIELVENGSNIRVNNKNKAEYVDLFAKNYLYTRVKKQVDAFREGFDSLINHNDIRLFAPNELGLLISGVPVINVDDLENNVEYVGSYNADTPVVRLFFKAIRKWDNDSLAKLIIFITGTSKIHSIGFKFLKQKDRPITIGPGGSKNLLPSAHTCINTLHLPEYETEEQLNRSFIIALNENTFQLK